MPVPPTPAHRCHLRHPAHLPAASTPDPADRPSRRNSIVGDDHAHRCPRMPAQLNPRARVQGKSGANPALSRNRAPKRRALPRVLGKLGVPGECERLPSSRQRYWSLLSPADSQVVGMSPRAHRHRLRAAPRRPRMIGNGDAGTEPEPLTERDSMSPIPRQPAASVRCVPPAHSAWRPGLPSSCAACWQRSRAWQARPRPPIRTPASSALADPTYDGAFRQSVGLLGLAAVGAPAPRPRPGGLAPAPSSAWTAPSRLTGSRSGPPVGSLTSRSSWARTPTPPPWPWRWPCAPMAASRLPDARPTP
jgi:hypothetical protein